MGLKCRASVLILVHFFPFFSPSRLVVEAVTHADWQDAAGLKQELTLKGSIHSPDNKTIWCIFFRFFFFFVKGGGA